MPKSQLVELHARGLGVIDDARVEFGAGFNVITGETGAGKTLLLEALQLCLGQESASARTYSSDELRASAVFIKRDGRETVLSRDVGPSGRLRSTLDGVASSADALRVRADELIVIHGQRDSLTLRNRGDVLNIIDASGRVNTTDLEETRRRLRLARAARDGYGGDENQRQRESEFILYTIQELEEANITSSQELDTLMSELTEMTDLRDGQSTLVSLHEELDSDSDGGILTRFAQAIDRLPAGEIYDSLRILLTSALDQAREGVHQLASLTEPDVFDPQKYENLIERASLLQQISRKHGGSLTSAIEKLDEMRSQRDQQRDASLLIASLESEIAELESAEQRLARRARIEREVAAAHLTEAVRHQLPRVALANTSLRFVVDGDDGSLVQILITPNPGLPEGPLQSLASGGELSRVLLALSMEMVHEDVVAVFDEIDAGVGGQVAQQIGECLREVGTQQQVLAVTHLASVAAQADHHFVIEKSLLNGRTTTSVRHVIGEERVNEIARMLAGDEITKESRALAHRLLETSC